MNQDGLDATDPEEGATLAARIGAGNYVTGNLLEAGGRITITVHLHQAGGNGKAPSRATAEGQATDVFTMVDGLVADLVADSMSAAGDRLTTMAATTSHSLEATKSYLRGEQLLRAGRYRESAEAYDAATRLDPGFALAHYRKSIAADWIDAFDIRSSADRALEFADELPERERALLQALQLRRQGRGHDAEQAYRAILHRYPEDVEAWTQLGETLFHENPRYGRSMLESSETFDRILQLEPDNGNARIHLARLHALTGDLEALAENARQFAASAPDSERALEVEALYAFSSNDPAQQAAVLERLTPKPAPFLFYSAHGVARFARSADGARRILEAGDSSTALLVSVRASSYLEQGQRDAFEKLLAGFHDGESPTWELYRAFLLTSGSVPADEPRMRALLARLEGISAKDVLESAWLPPYEDYTEEFARFELDYYRSLLLIQTGQLDAAREIMRGMEQAGPFAVLGSVHRDVLTGLDAEIHLRAGDDGAALDALRTLRHDVPHAISVRSIADGSRQRFLRAELERRIGDLQRSKAYYLGLDESWSWWDSIYRPKLYRALGEIAVREEQPEVAAKWYGRLLELWKDCDPALQAERAEVESALRALDE
jgi:tetratricopeptide (TPR) repeat protein